MAGDNVAMLWQALEDPPLPDQMRSWSQTRTCGRRWYILRGILLVTLFVSVMLLAAKVLVFCLAGKDLGSSAGIEILVLGPALGWLIFRDQWTANEKIYAENDGTTGGRANQS